MEFSTYKCHGVKFNKKLNIILNTVDWEKDFGIITNKNLSSIDHINEKVHKMQRLTAIMKWAFVCMDEEIVKIITTFIRPNVKYDAILWSPRIK